MESVVDSRRANGVSGSATSGRLSGGTGIQPVRTQN